MSENYLSLGWRTCSLNNKRLNIQVYCYNQCCKIVALQNFKILIRNFNIYSTKIFKVFNINK